MKKNVPKPALPMCGIFRQTQCLSFDQFAAYASSRAAARERREIEEHLAACAFCSEAMEGMEAAGDPESVGKTVSELKLAGRASRLSRPAERKRGRRWAFALAAALPIAAVLLLTVFNRGPETASLFDSYFEPYPNTIPLFRTQEPAGWLENAMAEYDAGDYRSARVMLETLLRREPENATAHFYAGIASLCLDDTRSALSHFRESALARGNDWEPQAAWYAALCHVRQGETANALVLLDSLSLAGGPFSRESAELAGRLRRNAPGP
ncbi:hypothetical protein JW777_05945 [bacterium]|nr:hypothetical protein [bacterium]